MRFQRSDDSPPQMFIVFLYLRENVTVCNCKQCCKQNVIRSLPESATCEQQSVQCSHSWESTAHWPETHDPFYSASGKGSHYSSYCTSASWQRCSGIHSMCNLQLDIPVASNKKNKRFLLKWHDKEIQGKGIMSQHLPQVSFESATSSLSFLLCLSCAKIEMWSKTQNISNKSTYKYQVWIQKVWLD